MKNDDFLRAIIANPDDDAPRLIYADWLEENGDSARAEFIRLQIALANTPRDDHARCSWAKRTSELLELYENSWSEELPTLPEGLEYGPFERGFIGELRTEMTPGWVTAVTDARSLIPLRSLALYEPGEHRDATAEVASLIPHLHDLEFSETSDRGTNRSALFAAFFPHGQALPYRRFVYDCLVTEDDAQRLASAKLPHLHSLRLTAALNTACLTRLQEASWWPQLHELELRCSESGSECARSLLARLSSASLRILTLGTLHKPADFSALHGSGLLTNLQLLHFTNEITIEPAMLHDLLSALPPTVRLTMSRVAGSDAALTTLAASPALNTLTTLPNFGFDISDIGVRALAVSPYGQRLRTISLHGHITVAACAELLFAPSYAELCGLRCHSYEDRQPQGPIPTGRHEKLRHFASVGGVVDEDGLAAWCAAVELPALETLRLNNSRFGPDAGHLLGNAQGLPALRSLMLDHGNPLGEDGLIALLAGRGLPRLENLFVRGCGVTVGTLRAWGDLPRLAQLKTIVTGRVSRTHWPDDASYAEYLSFRDHAWSLGCSVDGWTGASP